MAQESAVKVRQAFLDWFGGPEPQVSTAARFVKKDYEKILRGLQSNIKFYKEARATPCSLLEIARTQRGYDIDNLKKVGIRLCPMFQQLSPKPYRPGGKSQAGTIVHEVAHAVTYARDDITHQGDAFLKEIRSGKTGYKEARSFDYFAYQIDLDF